MKNQSLLLFILAISSGVQAQSKLVVEQYNYLKPAGAATLVPVIHFETKKNWCTQFRYNYEDRQTISLYAGKTFRDGKAWQYTLTPMLGVSAGEFSGWSLALNADMEWKDFYLSLESQYSRSCQQRTANFFFNWSELGYNLTDHLFAGFAFQYTREQDTSFFEPGIVAGYSFKNFSLPLYAFNPFSADQYYVLGLNIELSFHPHKNKQPL